uniref:Uncharacterized protein n=1 Tax=Rhizophora mucronata TaxID=61149 RepID=A0A2P2MJX8_RHIMU
MVLGSVVVLGFQSRISVSQSVPCHLLSIDFVHPSAKCPGKLVRHPPIFLVKSISNQRHS